MVLTYADVFRPAQRTLARLYDALLILGSAALIALSAQFAVRLPFSPVPITAQTLMVMLTGILLGRKLTYLAEGVMGLPVFAGGMSGLPYLFGPTGGYLLGFVAAAYVTGSLAERGWDRRPLTTVLAMLAGHVALYLPGLFWLSRFVGARVLALGFWPFVPGDLLKMALAMALLPLGWRWLGHHAFTAVNEGE